MVETAHFLRLQGWSLRRIQDWLNANRKAREAKPWANPKAHNPAGPHYRRAAEYVQRGRVLWERQRASTAAMFANVTQEELAEGVRRVKRDIANKQARSRRLRRKLGRDPSPTEIVAALRLDKE